MMRLYSGTACPFSQRCRIVLFEKGMDFEIIDIDGHKKPPAIAQMNPYGELPIIVERELVLYEANIINEYIDERFPHPQLMPADPVMRARVRLLLFTFEKELFVHIPALEERGPQVEAVQKQVADKILEMGSIFTHNRFMLGDEFSMLDVSIAPLLWRLDHYGIRLSGPEVPAIMKYAERLFSRPAFIEALTPQERVMRK